VTRAFGNVVGTLLFLVIAPGAIAGFVPWALSGWTFAPPFLGWSGTRVVGAALIVAGAGVVLESFARFALVGRGTPAPPLPTEQLVVSGLYRHVRNPMYVGVVAMVFGQALLFGNRELAFYGAVLWMGFFVFVLAYEEPTLRRRYGARYAQYCQDVGRWWPRLTPWRPPNGS
jgi:protein-S-isoprenylcysteine O-methyltransferase Ste14